MHAGQRSTRIAPPALASSHGVEALARGGSSSASAGMAGIGAGRSGAAASYRSFTSSDHRSYHDYNAGPPHWNAFDSSQPPDPTQLHGGLPSAQSTSSFDTSSRTFDAMSLPSSSSLYASQSMKHLAESTHDTSAAALPASSSSAATTTSSSSSSHQRAISEAELLAFVDQKRPKITTEDATKQSRSSPASNVDRGAQSKSAKDSSNSLDTLDLCHKRIDRVPDALVVMIKEQVVRLALGYNHLTRLPDNFADLHNLRYLNIRANNFAYFPECVTRMPNLEILDLSRNKVRTLPQVPGRLLSLRVLSMNANRLTELPPWVGKMKHLRILKLDNNPLEWPPPHISKMPNVSPPKAPSSSNGSSAAAEREKVKRFEDRQMVVWIAKLRSWINDPANQPQNPAISAAEQTMSTAIERREIGEADERADLASHARSNPVELPSSQSDGLMSLHVQVPQSVSDRTLRAHTDEAPSASRMQPDSVATVSTGIAPVDADAVAQGLLPPLVPQPSASDESANGAAPSSEFNASGFRSHHSSAVEPTRQPPQSSQSPSISVSEHDVRPKNILASQSAMSDPDGRQHARNNSHSVVQDIAATHQMEVRRSLTSKKSLPDLRKSHEDILQERRDVLADLKTEKKVQQRSETNTRESSFDRDQTLVPPASIASIADAGTPPSQTFSAIPQPSNRKPPLQARRGPRPSLGNGLAPTSRQGYEGGTSGFANSGTLTAPQAGAGPSQGGGLRKLSLPTVGATQAAAEAAAAALAARAGYSNTPPRFDVGHGRMASDRGSDNNWPSRAASPIVNGTRTAADQERNSYFRRLSTLPPSTISKAVPVPVLKFVDGTRGVLFALSQIHAAIGQFMTPVIDERISGQFHRLLDISNGSIGNLINALDRFDSLSRRGSPDASVIRGVLVTCKDSVITFRKLVSVLQLQLRALQSSSDVRYARTLLLMLYGSMAEVSNSWTEMAPLVEAVQPYLTQAEVGSTSPASSEAAAVAAAPSTAATAEKITPPSTRAGTLLQKSISNTSNGSTSTLPSIAEASTPVRAGARPYIARGPSRRRHAGSFSAQDLAQGAAMTPSNSNQPPFNLEDLQATSAYNTPARGARSRRQGSWGNSASSAATFAQSDVSDRSAAVDTTQSTAPSTPGGSATTAAQQRTIYATPGAMSTPTSSRQKRSGSNASSAMDAGGAPGSSAVTPRSQTTTPATPAAGAAKRGLHVATPSSGNVAATAAAGSRLRMAVSDPKMTVDDHLLDMVDNITKLSARVWSELFEHLGSARVEELSASSSEVSPVEDQESAELGAVETVVDDVVHGSGSDGDKEGVQGKKAAAVAGGDSESARKLRELRELAQVTDELTSQLRSTYLRAREEEQRRPALDDEAPQVVDSAAGSTAKAEPVSGVVETASPDSISQATVAKLFDESHRFVRAVVNTSTLIKAISVAHDFPRELRSLLGQVAQACSNLTVYLLWLSPTVSS
ncbi:hypothetical protein EX895_005309 [Sporisorium graminicola]|uniref:Uncharacterized protein n=1 Tax=Sporisorium graminicola TaxID=280036 RepID=A0A4V6YEL7_9BASI|nr:hypothetical protein EX895_005309 [Sporisorium graminicola]TKY85769.1 hypothetical protein EX895_005309 [Sporisorium graminicola]